jgi:hypothetical protein
VLVVILLFYWIVRRAFEIGRQALRSTARSRAWWPRASASGSAADLHQHGREPGPAADQGLTLPLVATAARASAELCLAGGAAGRL